jgi:glycosyltransferase involved in cell wall biosynthesis
MKIGIDATDLLSGGSITHLKEFFSHSDNSKHSFNSMVVWAPKKLIKQLPHKFFITYIEVNFENNGLKKIIWKKFLFDRQLTKHKIDILFIPGSFFIGKFRPYVQIARNLMPFEKILVSQYRFSLQYFRLRALKVLMLKSYRNSDGLIMLTKIQKKIMDQYIQNFKGKIKIIPHGISRTFGGNSNNEKNIYLEKSKVLKIGYVSIIDFYKNQTNVLKAAKILNEKGYKFSLEFAGNKYEPAFNKFQSLLDEIDPKNAYIKYLGEIDHSSIQKFYKEIDIFIFASSCEAFGQILTEAMRSALPIACSNKSTMPETLGDCGVYFDPDETLSIVDALEKLINSKSLRKEISKKAYNRSKSFSWEIAVDNTIDLISNIAK